MSGLKATLFGKFNVRRGGLSIKGMHGRKVQELLSYLLIFRNQPQPREWLAEALWGNRHSAHSKKYLRHTLWRLQSAFRSQGNLSKPILMIDNSWVQLSLPTDFWLDTAEFEKVFNLIKGKDVRELDRHDLELLESAADIYCGDLLEGWYQDWCMFERERFQTMYLMLLDKLVQYCEFHQKYEVGLTYGMEILRQDHAYERTHRQLMRLYVMTGNRTEALHQYMRCVTALRQELDVGPSEKTKQLYEQIRLDQFRPPLTIVQNIIPPQVDSTVELHNVLKRLEQFTETLRMMESRIQQEIVALEGVLSERS